eukprot:scaffold5297_cov33-Tisochrysis_lutea.AAC.1
MSASVCLLVISLAVHVEAGHTAPRRVHVCVNPNSGGRVGLTTLEDVVLPALRAAGCEAVVLQTEYAGHACDLAREVELLDGKEQHKCDEEAFTYLENRLNDECASPFHCKEQHRRTGLLRAFNPAFAYGKVNELWVHRLVEIPSFHHLPSVRQKLLDELPQYLTACRGTKIDHSEVPTFTKEVLMWFL